MHVLFGLLIVCLIVLMAMRSRCVRFLLIAAFIFGCFAVFMLTHQYLWIP